jgi:hypothetical protein
VDSITWYVSRDTLRLSEIKDWIIWASSPLVDRSTVWQRLFTHSVLLKIVFIYLLFTHLNSTTELLERYWQRVSYWKIKLKSHEQPGRHRNFVRHSFLFISCDDYRILYDRFTIRYSCTTTPCDIETIEGWFRKKRHCMKYLVIIFCLIIISSCGPDLDHEDPNEGIGCMTGIPKTGGSQRVLMRCCTRKEYLAGENVNAGGVSYFNSYTDHKWEKCDDCK